MPLKIAFIALILGAFVLGGAVAAEKSRSFNSTSDGLRVSQVEGPTLKPQTGHACPGGTWKKVKPAPLHCGYNDLGFPVHGEFRCTNRPSGDRCVETCPIFLGCVQTNK